MRCSDPIRNFEFTAEEIEAVANTGGLLSLEIEPSLGCNFRCPYCYVADKSELADELTEEEIRDVIVQAKGLGAKRIIILGGEPTIYRHILDLIGFVRSQDLDVEIFTNGSMITADFAKKLHANRVRVVLKMNSFREEVQDALTGVKGSFKAIRQALHNLGEAGYPSERAFLAVSTIICRQNIGELTSMWQWLRDRRIVPYFEIITPQGDAKKNEWLAVDPAEIQVLFQEISELDRTRYNQIWESQPPLVGNKCLRHKFSCLVNSKGFVMPCVGVNLPVGNIREQKLGDIIAGSDVIQDLRDHRTTIQGPCHTCEKADECYGCRGTAYQLTGNYLASDPLCWRNIGHEKEIVYLPTDIDGLIPQQTPMRIIDTVSDVGERWGEMAVTVTGEMPFLGEDGVLDEAAYMEMMAQSVAALNGFRQIASSERLIDGLLLGARDIEVLGPAHIGDTLKITVRETTRYGNFSFMKGAVSRNGEVLARGEIKILRIGDDGADTSAQPKVA